MEKKQLPTLAPGLASQFDLFGRRKPHGDIRDIPAQLLAPLTAKTYMLMNLAWDYVDTILDLCAQMKLREVRHLCRVVREAERIAREAEAPSVALEYGDRDTPREMLQWYFRRGYEEIAFNERDMLLRKQLNPTDNG